MSRFAYISLLVISSSLVGLLIAAILGTVVFSGEAAEGVGVYWVFSLPAVVVVSVLLGLTTFARYTTAETFAQQLGYYLLLTTAASVSGLAITLLLERLYMSAAA